MRFNTNARSWNSALNVWATHYFQYVYWALTIDLLCIEQNIKSLPRDEFTKEIYLPLHCCSKAPGIIKILCFVSIGLCTVSIGQWCWHQKHIFSFLCRYVLSLLCLWGTRHCVPLKLKSHGSWGCMAASGGEGGGSNHTQTWQSHRREKIMEKDMEKEGRRGERDGDWERKRERDRKMVQFVYSFMYLCSGACPISQNTETHSISQSLSCRVLHSTKEM